MKTAYERSDKQRIRKWQRNRQHEKRLAYAFVKLKSILTIKWEKKSYETHEKVDENELKKEERGEGAASSTYKLCRVKWLGWLSKTASTCRPHLGNCNRNGACNVYRKDNKEYLSATVAVRDTVQSTWHQSFRRCYLIWWSVVSVSDMLARCMFTMQYTVESISVVHHIHHAHSMRF